MSENGSLLQTFCGTRLYAAPEVGQPSYTSAVDIWSLGVVIYRFVHGLPTVEHRWDPQRWYQKLEQTINQRNSEELIVLVTSGMVKIDPRERLSPDECLKQALSLKVAIPAVQNLEYESEVPTESISSYNAMGAMPYSQTPTRDQCIEERLRTPARIRNSQDVETSISKTDGRRRRRTRSISYNRQAKRQRDAEIDAGSITVRTESPTGGSHERGRDQGVFEDPPGYVNVLVDKKIVPLRKSDYRFNATQICIVAGLNRIARRPFIKSIEKHSDVLAERWTGGRLNSWVPFPDGLLLCKALGLLDHIEPLIQYGGGRDMLPKWNYLPRSGLDQYEKVAWGTHEVYYRPYDGWVNVTQIFKAATQPPVALRTYSLRVQRWLERTGYHREIVRGFNIASGNIC